METPASLLSHVRKHTLLPTLWHFSAHQQPWRPASPPNELQPLAFTAPFTPRGHAHPLWPTHESFPPKIVHSDVYSQRVNELEALSASENGGKDAKSWGHAHLSHLPLPPRPLSPPTERPHRPATPEPSNRYAPNSHTSYTSVTSVTSPPQTSSTAWYPRKKLTFTRTVLWRARGVARAVLRHRPNGLGSTHHHPSFAHWRFCFCIVDNGGVFGWLVT